MGTRDIHHHQAALASEATRGWWINRVGGYSCRGCHGKNTHHPGLSTSPGWPQKQGPLDGGGYLSLLQTWVSARLASVGTGNNERPAINTAPQHGQDTLAGMEEFAMSFGGEASAFESDPAETQIE